MARQYRLMGCNDDHDTCECCGKTGLKRVVMLAPLDPDGNVEGEAAPYGTSCAARLLGYTWGKDPKVQRQTKKLLESEALQLEVGKLVDFYRATKANPPAPGPLIREVNRFGTPMVLVPLGDTIYRLVDRDSRSQPLGDTEAARQAVDAWVVDTTWRQITGSDSLSSCIREGFREATGVFLYRRNYETI